MTLDVDTLSPSLRDELAAATEAGLYDSEEAFLADAVRTFVAARPDVREALACKLYERGDFSLGRAAEWSGTSIETMKEILHHRGIVRRTNEGLNEITDMAHKALDAAGRSTR